jgi:3-oxoadipate enol-lactonase
MPVITVNRAQVYYEESGTGVPIVFSHGFLWSGRMFAPQLAALSATHRCITYDHRGQGQSPLSAEPYDMERLYEDAAALIEKLGVGPCHFVGLSMGGFVGLRLASRRPDLLRSLVLIESAADGEPRLNIPKYRAMAFIARRFGYRVLLRPIMKVMFGRRFLADPARRAERERLAAELLALNIEGTDAALESVMSRRPVEDELARIRLPTLVLHGDNDRAIVPARARRTAANIPGARLIMIPYAGHTSTLEEPAAITRELTAFYSRLA